MKTFFVILVSLFIFVPVANAQTVEFQTPVCEVTMSAPLDEVFTIFSSEEITEIHGISVGREGGEAFAEMGPTFGFSRSDWCSGVGYCGSGNLSVYFHKFTPVGGYEDYIENTSHLLTAGANYWASATVDINENTVSTGQCTFTVNPYASAGMDSLLAGVFGENISMLKNDSFNVLYTVIQWGGAFMITLSLVFLVIRLFRALTGL